MAKRKVKAVGGKKAVGKRAGATKAGKKRAPAKKRRAARSASAKKTKSAKPKKAKKAAAKKSKPRTSKQAKKKQAKKKQAKKKKAKAKTVKKVKRAAAAKSGQRSGKKPTKVLQAAAKTTRSKRKRSTAKSASAARSTEKLRPGSAPGLGPSTPPGLMIEDDPPRPMPKTRLSDEQLAMFRDMLLAKRAELVGDVDHLTNEALHCSRSEAAGDLSSMPIHMADIGSDNWEQEFTLGLIDNERALLVQIDEALERITARTYGVCLASRRPIAIARLRAKPWAKYSIEHARLREQGRVPR